MQALLEEMEPEWWAPNTIDVTTFAYQGKTYTISTCRLSGSPMPALMGLITTMGDALTGNEEQTDKDYETMLFIDGASNDGVYPFGDLPGNDTQGVYQRYDTEDEARKGHQEFVERVKQVLNQPERGV